jgi:hypothetical protein
MLCTIYNNRYMQSPWPGCEVRGAPGVIIKHWHLWFSILLHLFACHLGFSWFSIFSLGIVGASHSWCVLSFFECAHRKSQFWGDVSPPPYPTFKWVSDMASRRERREATVRGRAVIFLWAMKTDWALAWLWNPLSHWRVCIHLVAC